MEIFENRSQNTTNKKFIFLKIGSQIFAFPLTAVREVLGLGPISALPNMPPYFAGLINLRGKILSAVDLKKSLNFLNLSNSLEQSTKRPCVIIADVRGQSFGAIVDDVVEVQAIAETDIDRNIDTSKSNGVYEGIIKKQNSSLAPILNIEKALKINELLLSTQSQSAANS